MRPDAKYQEETYSIQVKGVAEGRSVFLSPLHDAGFVAHCATSTCKFRTQEAPHVSFPFPLILPALLESFCSNFQCIVLHIFLELTNEFRPYSKEAHQCINNSFRGWTSQDLHYFSIYVSLLTILYLLSFSTNISQRWFYLFYWRFWVRNSLSAAFIFLYGGKDTLSDGTFLCILGDLLFHFS